MRWEWRKPSRDAACGEQVLILQGIPEVTLYHGQPHWRQRRDHFCPNSGNWGGSAQLLKVGANGTARLTTQVSQLGLAEKNGYQLSATNVHPGTDAPVTIGESGNL